MEELIMVAFVLGMLVLALLGVIGLVNPSWVGLSSRSQSSLIYFGSSVLCLFIAIALSPESSQEENHIDTQEVERSDIGESATSEKPIEYVSLRQLIANFSGFTEAQRDRWRENNDWQHWVKGICVVSEVSSTNWMSEISDAYFEVTCELPDDNRAILFYDESKETEMMDLSRGDVVDFRGRLKTIRYWGFWSSGYVKVN